MEQPAYVVIDGTLVESTDAIVKHWHKSYIRLCDLEQQGLMSYRIGKDLGVDPNVVLQSSHGRRSIDTLKLYDPSKANWECPSTGVSSGLRYPFLLRRSQM